MNKIEEIIEKYHDFDLMYLKDDCQTLDDTRDFIIDILGQLEPFLKSEKDELKIKLANKIISFWEIYGKTDIQDIIDKLKDLENE